MKKQLVIIGIVVILITIGLSGCTEVSNTLNPEKNRFVGTWQNTTVLKSNLTIYLFSDGTCTFIISSGTWDLKDGMLIIESSSSLGTNILAYNYSFSNNNRTLTLINPVLNQTVVWMKQ